MCPEMASGTKYGSRGCGGGQTNAAPKAPWLREKKFKSRPRNHEGEGSKAWPKNGKGHTGACRVRKHRHHAARTYS
jgi:hypothetical protein